MALCVALQADGTVIPTGQAPSECAGYVLVSATEHAQMAFLSDLFQWPEAGVAASWLIGAFGFVIVCNVVGSQVGSVVKMLSTDRH
ncbi:hypothetical protein [Xanthomonas sp. XNM01]|uniref:hypothetical protein n=1 Tax=Xanthomonas sp. XNM01 TaxID=2769289 RepID=UPI0017834FCF|nr:hypothetical protein [Xanthomonas sp. XNM01]MBD9368370.1 hypothetical protein [Xanthomonas sp. XNM01]